MKIFMFLILIVIMTPPTKVSYMIVHPSLYFLRIESLIKEFTK